MSGGKFHQRHSRGNGRPLDLHAGSASGCAANRPTVPRHTCCVGKDNIDAGWRDSKLVRYGECEAVANGLPVFDLPGIDRYVPVGIDGQEYRRFACSFRRFLR